MDKLGMKLNSFESQVERGIIYQKINWKFDYNIIILIQLLALFFSFSLTIRGNQIFTLHWTVKNFPSGLNEFQNFFMTEVQKFFPTDLNLGKEKVMANSKNLFLYATTDQNNHFRKNSWYGLNVM